MAELHCKWATFTVRLMYIVYFVQHLQDPTAPNIMSLPANPVGYCPPYPFLGLHSFCRLFPMKNFCNATTASQILARKWVTDGQPPSFIVPVSLSYEPSKQPSTALPLPRNGSPLSQGNLKRRLQTWKVKQFPAKSPVGLCYSRRYKYNCLSLCAEPSSS